MKECLFCGMRSDNKAHICKACGTPFITESVSYSGMAAPMPTYNPQERGNAVARASAPEYPMVVLDACDTIDKVKAATVHIYGVYEKEDDMDAIRAGLLEGILGAIANAQDDEDDDDIDDADEYKNKADAPKGVKADYGMVGESGTGFFVNHNGSVYLVTNSHVVENTLTNGGGLSAKFPPEISDRDDSVAIEVLAADKINDVAILRTFLPLPEKAATLELADMETVRAGERVVTVGCPRHMEFNAVEGSVSNTCCKDHPLAMGKVLCTLNTTHGNSGGAIVRVKDSKVIGLVQGGYENDYLPGHTICVPVDAIKQLINIYERG